MAGAQIDPRSERASDGGAWSSPTESRVGPRGVLMAVRSSNPGRGGSTDPRIYRGECVFQNPPHQVQSAFTDYEARARRGSPPFLPPPTSMPFFRGFCGFCDVGF